MAKWFAYILAWMGQSVKKIRGRVTHSMVLNNGSRAETGGDFDPKKILMIVNTDNAYSLELAQYYQTKRGLDPAHILSYAFGNGNTISGVNATTANFQNNIIDPIATYILANDIQAVICSFVPVNTGKLLYYTGTFIQGEATSTVLAASVYIRDYRGFAYFTGNRHPQHDNEARLQYQGWDNGTIYDALYLPYQYSVSPLPVSGLFAGMDKGSGSLGNPHRKDAAGFALAKRCIDDAVDGATSGTVHFGLHDRTKTSTSGNSLVGPQAERARQMCVKRGVPTRHFIGSYDSNWPLQPPPASYDRDEMLLGNLDETAWGMCGSGIANEAVGAPYINSYTWVKGSWGFECTSFGDRLMRNMLDNGACAGIGTVYEPFTGGVGKCDGFMQHLLVGRSMMAAQTLCCPTLAGANECWGDPLYKPFYKA